VRSFTNDVAFIFPETELTNASPKRFFLPYLMFDSQGRMNPSGGMDEYIPLVKASIVHARDPQTQQLTFSPADVIEPGYRQPNPTNYNLIHIDWLTGRARLLKPQIR
jgi:hypothetical protein